MRWKNIKFKIYPWEQRKFKDIVIRRKNSSDNAELPHVEYEDINSGLGTLNNDLSQKKSNKKGIVFEKNDVLFGKLRPYLKNWLYAQFRGIAVGDFWVLKPNKVSGEFLYSLIQSPEYQIAANLSTGTKMPRSDWKAVSERPFEIPSEIAEMNKIGNVFSTLDNLIASNQRYRNFRYFTHFP